MGYSKGALMEAESGTREETNNEEYERVFEMWKTVSLAKDTANDLIRNKIISIENLVSEGNALVYKINENQDQVEAEKKELETLLRKRDKLEQQEELLSDAKESFNERV